MASTLPDGLFAFSLNSKDAARWPRGLAKLSAEEVASYLRFPDGTLNSFSKLVNDKNIGEALAFIEGIRGTGYTFSTVHGRLKRNRGGYGGAASETSDWDANDRYAHAMAMVYREARNSLADVGHGFMTNGSLENPECLYKIWVLLQFMKRNNWGRGSQKQSKKYLGKIVEEFKYEDFVNTAQESAQDVEEEQPKLTAEQVAKNFVDSLFKPRPRRIVVQWVTAPDNMVDTEHETTAGQLKLRPYKEFVFEAATVLNLHKVWHKVIRLEREDALGAWEQIYEDEWPQVQKDAARRVTDVQDQDMVIRLISEPHNFDLATEEDYWEEFQVGRTAADISWQRRAIALTQGWGLSAQASEQLCRGFWGPLPRDNAATDAPSADNAGDEDGRDAEGVPARRGHKRARHF